MSQSIRAALAACLAFLFLAGCDRTQPVYNVQDQALPIHAQGLSLAEIERQIVAAGSRRGWRFEKQAAGQLQGVLRERGHYARIDVRFSTRSYSITLVESDNLLQSGGEIHRNYNRWIHNLERDIDAALTRAGTTRT
ncbi:MAG: hypothetical protein KIT81_03385 [Alphaproteobacteria bacterium]|nr:hypothetical protein [Alphaproteobacteria bacterium]